MVGPGYTSRLIEFVTDTSAGWQPDAAARDHQIYSTRPSIKLFSSTSWKLFAVHQSRGRFGTSGSVRLTADVTLLGAPLVRGEYTTRSLVEMRYYLDSTWSIDTAF